MAAPDVLIDAGETSPVAHELGPRSTSVPSIKSQDLSAKESLNLPGGFRRNFLEQQKQVGSICCYKSLRIMVFPPSVPVALYYIEHST